LKISLGSNVAALKAKRSLDASSNRLATIFERLSSGARINRASDDAAGLAIASTLEADVRVFTQGVRNLSDGISALSIADGAMAALVEIVQRQRELAEQAANGVFSNEQRLVMNDEAQALSNEYQRILDTTAFNGVNLFTAGSLSLQNGYGEQGKLDANILEKIQQEEFDVSGLGTYITQDISFGTWGAALFNTLVIVQDLNGNGIDDVIAFGIRDQLGQLVGNVATFMGSESGEYSLHSQTSFHFSGPGYGGGGTMSLSAGYNSSLDRIELIWDVSTGQSIEGSISNSNGTLGVFSGGLLFGSPPTLTGGFKAGDFNGDGVEDLVAGMAGNAVRFRTQETESVSAGFVEAFADLSQQSFSLLSEGAARSALDTLEELQENIQSSRAVLGASLSRLATASSVSSSVVENYQAARSRIIDADIAQDSARLVAEQILQQSGAAVLSQASQQPQIALLLLDV